MWLILLSAVILPACVFSGDAIGISCRRDETMCVDGPTGMVHLPNRMIVAASESIFAGDSLLVRDSDYRLDYADGTVYFTERLPGGSCIRTKYSVFPFALKPSYAFRTVRETRTQPRPVRNIEPERPHERDKSYDLRASGSKTIRLEAGTLTDVRVNQALNLSIGGSIGDAVEVRGVLSDRDMSFGEAASTARIKDLDRIFMEVRSANGFARVGDLEIDQTPGELLRFRRNMTGFLADGSHGSKSLVMSGATTKSRYETVEIRGVEGIAGPYTITGPGGAVANMMRNSETVWLDGRRMERGSAADYVIDYAAGEIYFNPKHLIRSDARIVVDFELVDHDSRSQFYFGRSSIGLGGRGSVAVTFANEASAVQGADAAPAGLSGSLGADGPDGWVDGGRYVGHGQGSYVRIERDTLAYYEYVGEGLGEYDVVFTRVGEGKGTYSYVFSDSWDRYVHVFTGSGSYIDKVLPAPSRSARVTHVGASADLAEGINLAAEVAQSKGNVQGDGDSSEALEDRAYSVILKGETKLPEVAGRDAGLIGFKARHRSIGFNYIGFDRQQQPDLLEMWGQKSQDDAGEMSEVDLDYTRGRLKTYFDLGSFETALGRSRRQAAGLSIGDDRLGATASAEIARMASGRTDRGIERNAVAVRAPLKLVQLSAGRDYEARLRLTDSTSLRREEYHSRVRVVGGAGSAGFMLSRSLEDRDTGAGWTDYSSTLEGRATFEASPGRRFSLRGEAVQRRVAYAEGLGLSDRRITSGDLHLDVRDVFAVSSLAIDYSLANTLTSVFEADLVRIDGVGDYDSLGNHVPGAGTHVISRHERGKEPVTRVKAGLGLELGRKGKILPDRSLSSRTGLDVEGESVSGSLERVAFAHPGYLLNDPETRFARVGLTEELVYRRPGGFTVTLNAKGSRTVDGRCTGRKERRSVADLRARFLSTALRGTSLSLEGRFTANRSSTEMQTTTSETERDTWSGRISMERTVSPAVRGRMRLEMLSEERRGPAASFVQADLSPGVTVLVSGVRWDAGCSLKRVLRSEYSTAVLLPRRDSFDWNSRLGLRYGTHTSLSVEYTGRRMRDVRTIHNLRVSLSAAF
jgi:hypothetical protein